MTKLTDRELEILREYAEGGNSSSIGRKLHISTSSVKKHIYNAKIKLGAQTIAHGVHIAYKEGILKV